MTPRRPTVAGPDIREGTHAARPWGVSGPISYTGSVSPSEGSRLHTADRQKPRGLTWLSPLAFELAGSTPGACHSTRTTGVVRAGRAPPWVPGHGPRGHTCELPVTCVQNKTKQNKTSLANPHRLYPKSDVSALLGPRSFAEAAPRCFLASRAKYSSARAVNYI